MYLGKKNDWQLAPQTSPQNMFGNIVHFHLLSWVTQSDLFALIHTTAAPVLIFCSRFNYAPHCWLFPDLQSALIITVFICTCKGPPHIYSQWQEYSHLIGSTAASSEHANCWSKLTAIVMPDCTFHTSKRVWNSCCIVRHVLGQD